MVSVFNGIAVVREWLNEFDADSANLLLPSELSSRQLALLE